MILKEHKKHTALQRPMLGNFGRNEYGLFGAPCGAIKTLADQVLQALSPAYKCAYADAQHHDEVAEMPGQLAKGAAIVYTEHENYQQLNFQGVLSPFEYRALFSNCDMVLVNGNHHQAKRQVVIIDPAKKASLQKRIGELSDVRLFLLQEGETEVFDFIKTAIPYWEHVPVYQLKNTSQIIAFFEAALQQALPVLNGLVLAGGKSLRMGYDKGTVNWHNKAQRYYVADLLKGYCKKVFISCRAEQKAEINTEYDTLTDTFTDLGPYGAILSAFRQQPDRAWLVVACDMPLLNTETLEYLTNNRKVSASATTFQSPFDGFPEPLITIWEPKSYPLLLSFLSQGYSCPRKVLINSNTHILQAPDTDVLTNVNTPEELELVKQLMAQKTINA